MTHVMLGVLITAGALSSATSEIENYRKELLGIQEVMCEGDGTLESVIILYLMEKIIN